MTTWQWTVDGAQVPSGTVERSDEQEGTIEAEHMGDALVLLVQRDMWWDMLDTSEEVRITIKPLADESETQG